MPSFCCFVIVILAGEGEQIAKPGVSIDGAKPKTPKKTDIKKKTVDLKLKASDSSDTKT